MRIIFSNSNYDVEFGGSTVAEADRQVTIERQMNKLMAE
jgi:hypothetical protein